MEKVILEQDSLSHVITYNQALGKKCAYLAGGGEKLFFFIVYL